jgi:hypothetical protein
MDDAPPSARATASETQADQSVTGNTSLESSSGNVNAPSAAASASPAPIRTATPNSATSGTLQIPTRTVEKSKQPDAAAGSENKPLAAAAAAREPASHGHELPFVAPSSYLRRTPTGRRMADKHAGLSPLDRDQMLGLVSSLQPT